MEVDGNIYPIVKVQSWLGGGSLKVFPGRELTFRWVCQTDICMEVSLTFGKQCWLWRFSNLLHPLKGQCQEETPLLLQKPHLFALYHHDNSTWLCFRPRFFFSFFSCKTALSAYCFAPGTHQDQGLRDVLTLSPWYTLIPQKTFGSIPCPIDLISSTMVLGQQLLAHGMGETVSHAIITMALE